MKCSTPECAFWALGLRGRFIHLWPHCLFERGERVPINTRRSNVLASEPPADIRFPPTCTSFCSHATVDDIQFPVISRCGPAVKSRSSKPWGRSLHPLYQSERPFFENAGYANTFHRAGLPEAASTPRLSSFDRAALTRANSVAPTSGASVAIRQSSATRSTNSAVAMGSGASGSAFRLLDNKGWPFQALTKKSWKLYK